MNPRILGLIAFATLLQALILAAKAASLAVTAEATSSLRFEMTSNDLVAHGERLSAVLGCIGCHKRDLTGEDWSDPDYGVLWTANLTKSAADYSEPELAAMITAGKRTDRPLMDMPAYLFSDLHPSDVSALIRYLKSLPVIGEKHPEPTTGPLLAKEIESGEFNNAEQWVNKMRSQSPPDIGDEFALARHIARATCAECHGMDLRGINEPMQDAQYRPNLRLVIAYSLEEFSTLMRQGKGLGGRDLKVMGGVSRGRYSRFTDNEVAAMYDYLTELARRDP